MPELHGPVDGDRERAPVHRFRDIVERAGSHRLHRALDRAIGGHHDHRRFESPLLKCLQELHSIHYRHIEIAEHDIDAAILKTLQALATVAGFNHLIAVLSESETGDTPEIPVVIDHQEACFG